MRRQATRILLFFSVALAILLAVLAGTTWLRVRSANATYAASGRFVAVHGARLHYTDEGHGDVVVLLHGNPGSTRDMEPLARVLQQTHRVISIDRPGHGHSDRGSVYSPAAQAAAIKILLNGLEVQRPILIGHSWGGALALIYSIEYPDDLAGLVLVGTRALVQPHQPDLLQRIVRRPVAGRIATWTVLPLIGNGLVADGLSRSFAPHPIPVGVLAPAQALWLRPGEIRATVEDTLNLQEALATYGARFRESRTPTVLIAGEHDELLNESQSLRSHMPHAQLLEIPGAGHMVMYTHADTVAGAARSQLPARSAYAEIYRTALLSTSFHAIPGRRFVLLDEYVEMPVGASLDGVPEELRQLAASMKTPRRGQIPSDHLPSTPKFISREQLVAVRRRDVTDDDWTRFYREYGAGYVAVSQVLMTRDETDALVFATGECGGLCAESKFIWLHRARPDGHWRVVRTFMTRIS